MRLVVTADLHFNHKAGRPAAEAAVAEINRTEGDALLLLGDTGVGDGDTLEQALSSIHFDGPKLFVAGNHELWTHRDDSYALFTEELPRRVRALGWQWLETEPFEADGVAVVGGIGWHDYAFAPADLGVPERFFAAGVSPDAAERLPGFEHLLEDGVPASARGFAVRWNDATRIRLHRSGQAFLSERLDALRASLAAVTAPRVIAAVHHVPLAELLPPRSSPAFDFVRAYLGSPKLGELLLSDPRISHVLCGHSHVPRDVRIGRVRAVNVGSTYTAKRVLTIDTGRATPPAPDAGRTGG